MRIIHPEDIQYVCLQSITPVPVICDLRDIYFSPSASASVISKCIFILHSTLRFKEVISFLNNFVSHQPILVRFGVQRRPTKGAANGYNLVHITLKVKTVTTLR